MKLVIPLLISTVFLGACAGKKYSTIGDLRNSSQEETEVNLEKLNHEAVRTEYQEILGLIDDKDLKQQIERRIADVYMMEGQKTLAESGSASSQSFYQEAIKSYREVLDKYPNSPDNAEILYQLAKAYDMDGQQDEALIMLNRLTDTHPNYVHNAEAYFRKGDIYFNRKKYRNAEKAYRAITHMSVKKLRINAYYMLGWSLYKQALYAEGLEAFSVVLDDTLQGGITIESLSKIEKPLVKDTLHSMSLALVHNGGAEYIDKISKLEERSYVWMLYEELGEHYLDKERFEDSAATYRSYVTRYSKSEKAPELHSKLIQVYIKGGFPMQALPEKERFIEYYGLHSGYKGITEGVKAELVPIIKKYLEELARYYHANAQQKQKNLKDIKKEGKKDQYKRINVEALSSFEKAAKFYKEFIDTFPNDKKIIEMTYLKAETYYASYQYELAIVDYESVAYVIDSEKNNEYLAKAGYAAIISYQHIIDGFNGKSRRAKKWQKKAVDSMLRFAQTFYNDKRSPAVLANAAEYLFSLDQYEEALQVASSLINNTSALDKSLKQTAYGVMAHSLFNMERYSEAEKSYLNQRSLVDKNDAKYNKISDRIATTIYKKSEDLMKIEKQNLAIAELLKIKTIAPVSTVRITAQYDAATMMLALEQWSKAIVELHELIELFPDDKLSDQFPRKLAYAQERNSQWGAAAKSYRELSIKDKDAEVRREALFVSASLYEKNKNYNTAIELFKKYAHAYEQPFGARMEARYHLASNYELVKDMTRHLYWLRRIIEGDKNSGEQRNERSRWLAAWANAKYGDYFTWEFKRRKLRLPIESSLPKKNKTLKNSVSYYQKSANYGILEFVTLSSYNIANLYERFAKELREAPRPRGLSSDDIKTYSQILEEQALPFIQLAIDLHQANIDRAWQGQSNEWIAKSFESMKKLQPARYQKAELEVNYGNEIH